MTSCFGCHLSMQANRKIPIVIMRWDSRNFTTYNYQVLRDDVFMLGRDGTVTGNRIAPFVLQARFWSVRKTRIANGLFAATDSFGGRFSGQTFNTHVPHTVRD